MKKQIHVCLSLSVFVIYTAFTSHAQITSYPEGGRWDSNTTWIGGIVPGASDNVVIDGNVTLWNNEECLDITINSGDTLDNYGSGDAFWIHGNIVNNGAILYGQSLYSKGDITNNGVWDVYFTKLDGDGPQEISLQSGKVFESWFINYNNTDTIIAMSDLHFNGYFDVHNHVLVLNNYDIEFSGSDAWFGYGTVLSPGQILGTVSFYLSTTFEGNLTVTDTMQGRYGSNNTVVVNGSLINNGVIRDYGKLYVRVTGDITNNGIWNNYQTTFDGTGPQQITLQAGKQFESDFYNSNNDDTVTASSNLHFTGFFDLVNNTFDLNGYNIRFTGSDTYFGKGTIISPGEFLGTVNINLETHIEGNLVVTDTMQNRNYSASHRLYVNGNLTNNGVIQENPTGSLFVYITGDLDNHGSWDIQRTEMNGTNPQIISQDAGKSFDGFFKLDNGTDTVKATSDLCFSEELRLNSVLNMNHYNITFSGTDCVFSGGNALLNPNEIHGAFNIYGTTYIVGNPVVMDTLRNDNWPAYLYIDGDITNNGIIQNGDSYNLILYIEGDVTNNGKWENYQTYLDGTGPQNISLQAGKSFDSYFHIQNTTDTVKALTNLVFTDIFNLNNNILNLNHHNIRFTDPDTWLGRGTVISPDEFQGTVNLSGGDFYIIGNLTITDTLQKSSAIASDADVHLSGSLVNNGIIRDGTTYDVILYIEGDMANNGSWNNELTWFNGAEDQHIALTSGKLNTGEVRFEANNGSSPYQWYYNSAILDSPYFSGENSDELSWEGPLTDNWYGTYYCQTTARDSRNIMVSGGAFSFYFNGTDAYVDCGHDASLYLTTNISLEAWINPTGWGEVADIGYGRILDKQRFKLFLNDDAGTYNSQSLVISIHSGGSSYQLNTPASSISLDYWQHVAATYNGSGDVKVYINGIEQVLTGTPPPGNIDDHSLNDLLIGENASQTRAFDGDIDEVRYWSIVLDSTSIRENMYRELSGSDSGLVSYWKFNEDTGNIAYDFVGNNDGTLYNISGDDRIISTTPVPYYTVGNGNWEGDSVWATGQNAPEHAWTRVNISDSVEINSNFELIELTLDQLSRLVINSGYQLTVTGGGNGNGNDTTNPNNPPNPPGSPVPADHATKQSTQLGLKWSCSDPDGDPLTYDVYLDTGNPPTSLVSDDQADTSYAASLANGTTYYWKIVAFDDQDSSTAGPVWDFTTNQLPDAPNSPVPGDGETGQSASLSLQWACSDPEGDNLTYDVYLDTNDPPVSLVSNNQADTFYIASLSNGTTYYWKIIAFDTHGDSTVGPGWDFETNLAPAAPNSPVPGDDATGQSTSLILQWACSDPEGDPLTYDVYLDNSNPPTTLVADDQADTSYAASCSSGLTYYWKVVASDDQGNSTPGPVWDFTTNDVPDAPNTPDPANGATGQSISTTLHWACSDPDGDALTYTVYFGMSSPPPLVASGVSDTLYDPGTLEYDTTCYWRIVAIDIHSDSTTGPIWSFETAEDTSISCPDSIWHQTQYYELVLIGNQCWFAENVSYGKLINQNTDQTDNGKVEMYCYSNDTAYCLIYGGLYRWGEMMQYSTDTTSNGICPSGWHIPTDYEWKILEGTVDSLYDTGADSIWNATGWRGYNVGYNLKSQSGWKDNGNGSDAFGFTALPGGYQSGCCFFYLTAVGHFWSSTEYDIDAAWFRKFNHGIMNDFRNPNPKGKGYSVRCIKDQE